MASRSRIASRSGSGPASGWYSSSGAKSVCTPSRPPASRTWLTCSRSSDTARPPLSASRAIACNATRKLSIWSAICWVKSSKSLAGSFSSDAAGTEFWLLIYCSSPFESSSQGHLVGILEVTAYRQSTSKSRHAQPHRFEQPREIGRGGLPLEVRVRRQDDFGDHPIGQACHQLADAQVVRADPLDRRDRATEHVVAATELAGAFDRDDVLGLLHDTDHRKVPPRVTTDPALLILRHVAADRAELHPVFHLGQDMGEPTYVRRVCRQDVERDALRALGSHARESPQLVDQVLDDAFVHRGSLFLLKNARPRMLR